MSVTGIVASSLFANAASQIGQSSPSTANASSGAQSPFAALQQKLMGSTGSTGSTAGTSSIPAQLTQLGQDLKSGNLTAAQADFSSFKMSLAQAQTKMLHHFQSGSASSGSSSQAGSSGTSAALLTGSSGTSGQSGTGTDPLAAAMLAYSSLQQNASNGGLSSSLMTPTSTFAIDA